MILIFILIDDLGLLKVLFRVEVLINCIDIFLLYFVFVNVYKILIFMFLVFLVV